MGEFGRRTLLVCASALTLFGIAPASVSAQSLVPCGVLRPCPPPPPPPDSEQDVAGARHEFDLSVGPRTMTEGGLDDYRVTGSYRVNGAPYEGRRLTLIARQWPYKTETNEGTVFSGPFGNFDLRAYPQLNTEYYVATDDLDPGTPGVQRAVSAVTKVLIYPKFGGFHVDVVRPYVVEMSFDYDFPDAFAFRLKGRKIHWYVRRGKKVKEIATSRSTVGKDKTLEGQVRTKVPRGRRRVLLGFCFNIKLRVDTGVGRPERRRCP